MIRTGETFGGYELEELVSEGRRGAIYLARDVRLGRPVALRLVASDLTADPVTRARLNRELTMLAAVDHPNVPPMYEAGEQDGRIFVASRWVEGVSISALIDEEGPLDPRRAVRIVNQIASALQAAHELGIMHRNVKPSAVLVTQTDHAYLTDFGLARRPTDMTGLTVRDELVENFDYVAPEYISGQEVDARVDIYGLGCVLYEALTGEVPYPHTSPVGRMYSHLSSEPPSPRQRKARVPEILDAVVRRALAKDPGERQQTAGDFALEAAGAVGLSAPLWARREDLAAGGGLGSAVAEERSRGSEDVDGDRTRERVRVRGGGAAGGVAGGAAAVDGVVAPDGESTDVEPGEYADPVYFAAEGEATRPILLWTLGVLLFLAAPIALIVALLH